MTVPLTSGPAEQGGLPGLVPVIFESSTMYQVGKKESPGGFKTSAKVKSRWLQKRSARPEHQIHTVHSMSACIDSRNPRS